MDPGALGPVSVIKVWFPRLGDVWKIRDLPGLIDAIFTPIQIAQQIWNMAHPCTALHRHHGQ